MIEYLPMEEVARLTKKWDMRLNSADSLYNNRSLYDLIKNIVAIRAAVGLNKEEDKSHLYNLQHHYQLSADLRPADLKEPVSRVTSWIGEPGSFQIPLLETFEFKKTTDLGDIATYHRIKYISPLAEGKISSPPEGESTPIYLVPRALRRMAIKIWSAHLANDAPMKNLITQTSI